jgi:hypothetical protein
MKGDWDEGRQGSGVGGGGVEMESANGKMKKEGRNAEDI